MLMCACAHAPKGWKSDHENKIREILRSGPSAKIYTLEIYPLYGSNCIETMHIIIIMLSGKFTTGTMAISVSFSVHYKSNDLTVWVGGGALH